ncbi:WYL domain-containing protein [Ferrimonas aestuarii]|uniref:WYL domain-containing protein n=1 Tax=Ferrimonas aestuarii TaxID=2569539 RepID=A0A4U1BS44_9GAMM|nr:WYL domain-containing protein [Ferrimonas aestuarii]TKB57416.1 WYL domain-containing protein [Ferrimonas aestuarii]
MNQANIKWDQQIRFRHMEIIALWEGRLNTNHLCQQFGIGRQQASRDINHYLKLHPSNLDYDTKLKGYRPSGRFHAKYSNGSLNEYLHHLQQLEFWDAARGIEVISSTAQLTSLVSLAERPVDPKVVRPLLNACRSGHRVKMHYASLASGNEVERVFVPHTLVHDGFRWHCRGYCETQKAYLDLVLTRIRSIPKRLHASEHLKEGDVDWNEQVSFTAVPNPLFNPKQQRIVAADYGFETELHITTRKALLNYQLRALQISSPIQQFDLNTQMLVVKPEL